MRFRVHFELDKILHGDENTVLLDYVTCSASWSSTRQVKASRYTVKKSNYNKEKIKKYFLPTLYHFISYVRKEKKRTEKYFIFFSRWKLGVFFVQTRMSVDRRN